MQSVMGASSFVGRPDWSSSLYRLSMLCTLHVLDFFMLALLFIVGLGGGLGGVPGSSPVPLKGVGGEPTLVLVSSRSSAAFSTDVERLIALGRRGVEG
mmetsp:Transcript_3549/g.12245  ORF Transcript_3549/g.12245 Transcript_3549/m.12245 type:complete len:98 (-) Transcript_3549:555-848(-)